MGIALILPTLTVLRKFPGGWWLGLGLVAITLGEWLLANLGLTASTLITRSVTGVLAGVGLVLILSEYVVSVRINFIFPALLIMAGVWLFSSIDSMVELTVILSFLIFWTTAFSIFIRRVSTTIKREFLNEKAKSSA